MFFLMLFLFFIVIVIGVSIEGDKKKQREALYNSMKNGKKSDFSPTTSVANPDYTFGFFVDGNARRILIADLSTELNRTIPFNDIVECSILENGATVQSGGVGRAIVGGALAGGVGAIVGATTRGTKAVLSSLSIRIVTKDINNALCEIPIVKTETKRDSDEAKNAIKCAQKIYATVISIIDSVNNSPQTSTQTLTRQPSSLKKVVIPLNGGEDKIKAIKIVREITGLGLAEAKDLVEQSGVVEDGISYDFAQSIVEKFKGAGITATILDSLPQAEAAPIVETKNPTKAESSNQIQSSSIELLQQLADLRDKGILTDAEFTAKKHQILGLDSPEE